MDVAAFVHDALASWDNGGADKCRATLLQLHAQFTDNQQSLELATAYNALLNSTTASLSTNLFTGKPPLTATSLTTFILSVLESLPSSSRTPRISTQYPEISAFSNLFVDLVWTVDAELDELVADAKTVTAAAETSASTASGPSDDTKAQSASLVAAQEKAKITKETAEKDKDRLVEVVKRLALAKALDLEMIAQRLDTTFVGKVGLLKDVRFYEKKEIRIRTGLFYKQTKFNLLREQSEGYSKLTTELTASLGPPHDPSTGLPVEDVIETQTRAQSTWERIVSLIGYFDLDPNRALDVTLDIFAVHITNHWSFMIALLDCTPWGTTKESTGEFDDDSMQTEEAIPSFAGRTFEDALEYMETRAAGGRKPPGGRVDLAQILGFKFSYYQLAEVEEATPYNLYLTAALLIREGFITLEQLYPHLSPDDEDMEKLHKAYTASIKERIEATRVGQLAMAAPLASDSVIPATSATPASKPRPAEPVKSKAQELKEMTVLNQKVGLLAGLLSLGVLKPTFAVLSRFPWLVDACPRLADILVHLLSTSIERLSQEHSMLERSRQDATQKLDHVSSGWGTPRPRYGVNGMVTPGPPRSSLTTICPTPPRTSTVAYVYFFPEWTNRLPLCKDFGELLPIVTGLLRFTKLHIYRSASAFSRLLELVGLHLHLSRKDADKETIHTAWFNCVRTHLIPAYSMLHGNVGCAIDLFTIMRNLESIHRWPIYAEWRTKTMHSHPELRVRAIEVERESKTVMRRLSVQNVHTLDATIGKLAQNNPCIFFPNAVNQVMAYDNLATVLVDSFGRMTNLAHDVLSYVIFDALSNPNKQRVKDDGANASDWLLSLSKFIGVLYRKFNFDISPLLQYVVHQLHNRQVSDIIILRDLINHMAGIEPLPSLEDSQIAAMASGPTLRIEVYASKRRGLEQKPHLNVVESSGRLTDKLLSTKLGLPLLVQLAQQRQACVFQTENAPIKSLANLYDLVHGVLFQYLELLNSQELKKDKKGDPIKDKAGIYVYEQTYCWEKILPTFRDLHVLYGVCAPIVMQIFRPKFNHIVSAAVKKAKQQHEETAKEAEKRLKAALTAKRELNGASQVTSTEEAMDTDSKELLTPAHAQDQGPWISELADFFDDIKLMVPEATDVMGAPFYMTFWQMTSYDLVPPSARYEAEIARIRSLAKQEDAKIVSAERVGDLATSNACRKRRDKYHRVADTMDAENQEQKDSRLFTINRLAKEKTHWFKKGSRAIPIISAIIEHCLHPRCVLSPMDADYCAQIIKVLHTQGTEGFYTLMLYNKLFDAHVSKMIFSSSENETRNYGRFLSGVLSDLWKWHKSESLFDNDNNPTVAGKTETLPGFQAKWLEKDVLQKSDVSWTYFLRVHKKWHKTLTKTFCACIDSGDYMHIHNAIKILSEVSAVFPMAAVYDTGGKSLYDSVNALIIREKRNDLKVLGLSYLAQLKSREKEWRKASKPTDVQDSAILAKVPERPAAERRESTTVPQPMRPAANGVTNHDRAPSSAARPSSVPRPDVIKRVRPASGNPTSTQSSSDQVDMPKDARSSTIPAGSSSATATPVPVAAPRPISASVSLAKDTLQRQASLIEQSPSQSNSQEMPPPVAPSQTVSAQELRDSARVSTSQQSKADSSLPSSPASRRRSASPNGHRPGTRNASADSRTSGSSRPVDTERDARNSKSRRNEERDRDPSRSERSDRREAGRDREREKTRDRDESKLRSERDRERDRGDRERGRHHREEKDRGRDRKDRDAPSRTSLGAIDTRDERDTARPESRRRSPGDTTPKRRRPDDDGDREPKRSSRRDREVPREREPTREKDGAEDRSRRHTGDRDRRRRDRDETDDKGALDRSIDRRSGAESPTVPLPSSVPSGPRAMAHSDSNDGRQQAPRQPRQDTQPPPRGDRYHGPGDHPPRRDSAREPAILHDAPVARRDPPIEREHAPRGGQQRDSQHSRDHAPRGHNGSGPSDSSSSQTLLSRLAGPSSDVRGPHGDSRGDSPSSLDGGRKRIAEDIPNGQNKRLRITRSDRYVTNEINQHISGSGPPSNRNGGPRSPSRR